MEFVLEPRARFEFLRQVRMDVESELVVSERSSKKRVYVLGEPKVAVGIKYYFRLRHRILNTLSR